MPQQKVHIKNRLIGYLLFDLDALQIRGRKIEFELQKSVSGLGALRLYRIIKKASKEVGKPLGGLVASSCENLFS
jgi:hypothetical protein